ncbi:MAG: carbon monoxide dehydrogenase [Clostridia bacterium]|nr:MAG: carbon monoxide dehydrogenase [Clostridia bacterium]
MKIAVSGKGGVGKTTLAAGLVHYLAGCGYTVYAVDADADASLGLALGLPEEVVSNLAPVVDMREDVARATGGSGAFFSLNPDANQLLSRFTLRLGSILFLKMGSVKQGGTSCYCRENSVLHALVSSLLLEKQEVVVMDMSAGIEHLTRGTARGVDLMLVVTEPSRASLQTARLVARLATDLGVSRVKFIGNKVRSEAERDLISAALSPGDMLGNIPFAEAIWQGSMAGGQDNGPVLTPEMEEVVGRIVSLIVDTEEKVACSAGK